MKSKSMGSETTAMKQSRGMGGGEYVSPNIIIFSLQQQDVLTGSNDFDISWGEDWDE